MANTINIPKPHLIMGLCLPLAVLVGYFLAEPTDLGSVTVIGLVLAIFSVPFLMRWYHPLLVLSWNACIAPAFLPGQVMIWTAMAGLALMFAVLNRSVNPYRRFTYVPSITRSLICLGLVVAVTGFMTGGFGLRMLGSAQQGGKRYFLLVMAIVGYFGFTSQRIPIHRANLYVGMFFFTALTALIPNVVSAMGQDFAFLYSVFPAGFSFSQEQTNSVAMFSIVRFAGFMLAGPAVASYLMARYGLRGALDVTKPWRLILLVLAGVSCTFSGFRSTVILYLLTVGAMFFFEGLHRTRVMLVAMLVAVLGLGFLFVKARSLPLTVQRTLSFLPVKVDPMAQRDADDSTHWRVEMWKQVLPEVPKHLLRGKGYTFDPDEMYFAAAGPMAISFYGHSAGAALAGDYHSGPLSVVLPFGLWGVGAFGWFLVASLRYLHRCHRQGHPELRLINTFLLASFWAKLLFFIFIFGSLNSDLCMFTGIVGFSVSLNGLPEAETETQPVDESLNLVTSDA